jgi:hypothetical protein
MHAPRQPAIKLADRDGDRSRFVLAGDVDTAEWLDAYERFAQTEPGGHVLWDLTEATLSGLTSAAVYDLAPRLGAIRARHGAVGRFALVCTRDVDFGLARMLVIYARLADPPTPMEAFRNSDVAWRWLSDAVAS